MVIWDRGIAIHLKHLFSNTKNTKICGRQRCERLGDDGGYDH